ncbi:hypothetical protein J4227_01355 [Candidatus Woesearchaeota archaeon]|nr:hypothetical protein [Candidatus Woesearchaeota archaeon]
MITMLQPNQSSNRESNLVRIINQTNATTLHNGSAYHPILDVNDNPEYFAKRRHVTYSPPNFESPEEQEDYSSTSPHGGYWYIPHPVRA